MTIFVRSVFRVAELQGGFDSDLANDEIILMVLESAMIAIACICLTGAHPGVIMGDQWRITAKSKKSGEDIEVNKFGSQSSSINNV